MLEIIIYLIVSVVGMAIVFKVFSALFKLYPALMYVLIVLVALFVGVAAAWWAGIIAGLIAFAVFSRVQDEGGHKCLTCYSWDTTEVNVTQNLIDSIPCNKEIPEIQEVRAMVKCNKCGAYSTYLKSYSEIAAEKNRNR